MTVGRSHFRRNGKLRLTFYTDPWWKRAWARLRREPLWHRVGAMRDEELELKPALGRPGRVEDGVWLFGYRHARDIPDALFLEAMDVASREFAQQMGWPRPLPANRWTVASVLGHGRVVADVTGGDVPGVPPKLVLAKAKRLIARGLIRGCACGCRGDFEVVGDGAQS